MNVIPRQAFRIQTLPFYKPEQFGKSGVFKARQMEEQQHGIPPIRDVANKNLTKNRLVGKDQLILDQAFEERVLGFEMGDPDAGINENFHRHFVQGREDLQGDDAWVPMRLAWFRPMQSSAGLLRVPEVIEALRESIPFFL